MPGFRLLDGFNAPELARHAGSRTRILNTAAAAYFDSDRLADRLFRALASLRTVRIKELVEAFEFYAVARKHVRAGTIVDLCCGHGLVGLLFAAFDRDVHRVLLNDRRQPQSFETIFACVAETVPRVADRVSFLEGSLDAARAATPRGAGVVAVHACGSLTDDCLDVALEARGPVAVLPCCRSKARNPAPRSLRRALGNDVAYDVHRTYRLEDRGYRVRWGEIPAEVTPMNRVLSAVPPSA